MLVIFVDYYIIISITKHNIIYLSVQTKVSLNTIISNLMNYTIIIRQTIITHQANGNGGNFVKRELYSIVFQFQLQLHIIYVLCMDD